jgi:hypothetical protein
MLNSALDEKKAVLKPIPPSLERQSTLNGIKEGLSIKTNTKRSTYFFYVDLMAIVYVSPSL